MPNLIARASIIDWIKWPFGYLLRGSYQLIGSYAVAIIIFALVIRIVLLPFGIKQQKGMIVQAKLRPKEMKIRNKYKGRNDRATQEKMNAEIMELYQREKYSPFSGCLPLLIQLPIILILFYVVTAPMTYVAPVMDSAVYFTPNRSVEEDYNVVDTYLKSPKALNAQAMPVDATYKITKDGKIYNSDGTEYKNTGKLTADDINGFRKKAIETARDKWFANDKSAKNKGAYAELNFLQNIKSADKETQNEIVAAIPDTEKLLEFKSGLFGMDLLGTPSFTNWLIIIPILSGIITYLSSWITKKLNNAPPAAANGSADVGASLKIMDFVFPLFSVYIAFIVPGAVGFYWMMSNLIMIGQSFLLSKILPIPKPEEIEAAYEAEEKDKKKKKQNTEKAPIEAEAKEISGISVGSIKDDEDK